MSDASDIDPGRFAVHDADPRRFRQAFVREGVGGVPLVCVHGWPESKRIFWKVIAPFAAAGFEVIVPDLRGFGDSDVGPDGFHDVTSHALDLYALVHDVLGHQRVVLLGGDLGGPVIQHLALRQPDWVDRLVLFNSPVPHDKEAMAGWRTRAAREASDYYVRQGTDADALAAELATPEQRLATSPPSTRHDSGPTRGASSTRAHLRAATAAAPSSTSTPSPSATGPTCGRRSAATRASSTSALASRRRS
jgi:pimeloyl-ACP methyl ester carboxylesterase